MSVKMNRAIVVFSGGQDSTTCLHLALTSHTKVKAITFDYGQRHAAEVVAATRIAAAYGVEHEVINVRGIFVSESPLVNTQNDVGQYDGVDALPGGIENTFVEGRNMVFLAIAANRAAAYGASRIYIGISQEDFGGYPDCRAGFLHSMQTAINKALGIDNPVGDGELRVVAPLMHKDKASTAIFAHELPDVRGVRCDEALSYSHTCYRGMMPPCGRCHACILRQNGYDKAGLEDPLIKRFAAKS